MPRFPPDASTAIQRDQGLLELRVVRRESTSRSKPQARLAPSGAPDARERRTAPGRRLEGTIFAGVSTAMRPAPAPSSGDGPHTSSSSSRSRTRSHLGRSRPSRCPRVRASATSAASASRPSRARRADAARRPPSWRRSGCGRRDRASDGHAELGRRRRPRARRRPISRRRSPRREQAARRRRSQRRRLRHATVGGTADGARSSRATSR
jgi:hypothetical protein